MIIHGDFVADEGALTSGKPGQDIEKDITSLTNEFIQNGDYVVFAIDAHEEGDDYHPETKLFPPHNIIGSKGRQLFSSLKHFMKITSIKKMSIGLIKRAIQRLQAQI